MATKQNPKRRKNCFKNGSIQIHGENWCNRFGGLRNIQWVIVEKNLLKRFDTSLGGEMRGVT